MTTTGCPMPEVAAVLDPFIKPRDEVAAIRQNLQSHLHNAFGSNNTSSRLSLVTLHEQELLDEARLPPVLAGVRKAYWKAVRAHTDAQSRYDALRADLQQLRVPRSQDLPISLSSDSINNSYIPLLRLRESLRKLQVIDQAFSEIASTGTASSSNSVESIARRRNGEPPVAPQTDAAPYRHGPDVEARILQLKKAVLTTKRQVHDHVAGRSTGTSKRVSDSEGEIAGLQSALNELTGWMETQLSLIGSAEAAAQPAAEVNILNGQTTPEAASLEDIADLYHRYLTARQGLIHSTNNPASLGVSDPSDIFTFASRTSWSKDTDKRTTPSEIMLPHVLFLTNLKQEEQSMLEQSAYLRRQITAVETGTNRLVARLADESHLITPGAGRGEDWAGAAASASAETKAFVGARLQLGRSSTLTASKALKSINTVPKMMNTLSENR